jgi:cAMP-dependent protein kinase regulator
MSAKRSIRELERQCKKEPDNLVPRLLLAAAYREAGRTTDAITIYRSVADTYQQQGRRTQAVAVLRSLLEIDPEDGQSQSLLALLDREATPSPSPPPHPPAPGHPPVPPPLAPEPGQTPPPGLGRLSLAEETPAGPSRRLAARVLAEDVVLRELTPVRPPGVPASVRPTPSPVTRPSPAPGGRRGGPPGEPSPGTTLTGLGAAGPSRRGPGPSRSSSGLYTPTPLPAPVPFHEGEATTDLEHRVETEPADEAGDDVRTRIAEPFRARRGAPPPLAPPARPTPPPARPTGRQPTATDVDLAADVETRRMRRFSDDELQALAPPPGQTDRMARVEPADLEDDRTRPDAASPARAGTLDDEPTRIGDDRGRPGASTGELEVPTSVRDEPALAAAPPRAPAPPIRPPLPALPARPARPALPPVPAPPGRIPRRPPGRLTARPTTAGDAADEPTQVSPSAEADERTRVHGDTPERISRPGMHRSRTFTEQSFTPTLGEMDPDGAAIDAPLELFSMLPPPALAELGRRMRLRHFEEDETIVREGDPGDACYVIADGEVCVLKNDPLAPDAGPVEVARLGSRALFGEFALLADRRRHATVRATTACDVYEIPRQLLRELAASFADVGPALETFYRQRLLATLLRTAPFFAPLPEEQRAQLLARFVPIRAESGEPIVREGQTAGGLYLIVIGAVEITRRLGKHRSVILATLREGAYFGEMSLLSGEPTTATVVAAGPVELALLPPRDFYEIVASHPQLWAAIRREARTRALENARLLAGETGTV